MSNAVTVPADKLKQMQDEIKRLRQVLSCRDAQLVEHVNLKFTAEREITRLREALEYYTKATSDGGFADDGQIARAALSVVRE
jgi:hypothetical protein